MPAVCVAGLALPVRPSSCLRTCSPSDGVNPCRPAMPRLPAEMVAQMSRRMIACRSCSFCPKIHPFQTGVFAFEARFQSAGEVEHTKFGDTAKAAKSRSMYSTTGVPPKLTSISSYRRIRPAAEGRRRSFRLRPSDRFSTNFGSSPMLRWQGTRTCCASQAYAGLFLSSATSAPYPSFAPNSPRSERSRHLCAPGIVPIQ